MRRAIGWLLVLQAACTDPFKPDFSSHQPEPEELCAASADWLPNTPELQQFLPLPHPASECPFYRGGWQVFLRALQPDAMGRPAILDYPTLGTVFTPKVPHPLNRSFLGDIKQAGGRQILIDQNGNSIYYGIHVNQAFADFIRAQGLQTADALKNYPRDPSRNTLTFPPGVEEFKSAWQIVEGDAQKIALETAGFVSIQTTVPTLSQDPVTHQIKEDRNTPRRVTVRLLALHVVFTLPGHPEFIWASFEHTTGPSQKVPDAAATDGQRDVAPITPDDKNPTDADPTNRLNSSPASVHGGLLYRAGTPMNLANLPKDETRELRLDPVTQKLHLASDNSLAQTSIYRMFPASKSNTTHPDDAVTSLNHNVEVLFSQKKAALNPSDKRGNYRLIGAQWMDKPRFFKVGTPLQNDANSPMLVEHRERVGDEVRTIPAVSFDELTRDLIANGSDSDLSILAGEDRLSSTALESFTQGPDSFDNCLTCHNTQAITANGIPLNRDRTGTPRTLLEPGLLNVSHVLSQFLLEESEAP
jgi:hypothetical protein